MKWVYTAHDPLWTACQRASYAGIVRRAASGVPALRDAAWLELALPALGLTHADYIDDLSAMLGGAAPPRLLGTWPAEPNMDVAEYDMSQIEEVE